MTALSVLVSRSFDGYMTCVVSSGEARKVCGMPMDVPGPFRLACVTCNAPADIVLTSGDGVAVIASGKIAEVACITCPTCSHRARGAPARVLLAKLFGTEVVARGTSLNTQPEGLAEHEARMFGFHPQRGRAGPSAGT